jgi:hypothetical protein
VKVRNGKTYTLNPVSCLPLENELELKTVPRLTTDDEDEDDSDDDTSLGNLNGRLGRRDVGLGVCPKNN